jgi:hypothetical protein
LIVTGRRQNFVTAAQHVLPHDLRWHVRVARLSEVAVRRPANKAALALGVEPAGGFSIRNHWSKWCALSLIAARGALLLLLVAATTSTSTAAATTTALSAASALIASATSVLTVIAIAVLALIAPLLSLSTAAAALAGLRIVLRLLL